MKETFFIYSIGGVIAVAIDIGLLYFFHDIIGIDMYISAIGAFVCSSLFGFFYHKKYSFHKKALQEPHKNLLVQFGQFLGINSVTQSIYMMLLFLGTTIFGMYYLIVAIFAKAVVFIGNFLGHNYITFKTGKHERYILYGIIGLIGVLGHYTNSYLGIGLSSSDIVLEKDNSYDIITNNNEDMTRYQIIPDRWANGDIKNDFITTPLDWSQIPQNILEEYKRFNTTRTGDWFTLNPGEEKVYSAILEHAKDILPTPKLSFSSILKFRRYGGDFEGMRNNIPHLESLGISGIILNPVWLANAPIRYDVIDYRHIDPRLSSIQQETGFDYQIAQGRDWTKADKDFMKLINDFHAKGIKVVIDFAFTYSAANSVFLEDIARKGKNSEYYNWFELYMPGDADYDKKNCSLGKYFSGAEYNHAKDIKMNGRWGFCHLVYVKRDYSLTVHPEYEKFVKRIITRWMQPQTIDGVHYDGVDGVRLDAGPELPKKFKKELYNHIKSIKSDATIIHEDRKNNYATVGLGETDGLTNYFTRTLAELFFIGKDKPLYKPGIFLNLLSTEYGGINRKFWLNMLNQISSHDTDRIATKLIKENRGLSGSMSGTIEWFALNTMGAYIWDARDINRIEIADQQFAQYQPPEAINTLRNSIIMLQFMLPGSPSIFYGDEVGMWGADDPDNRKPMLRPTMNFAPQSECLYDTITYCNSGSKKHSVKHNKDLPELYKKLIALRKSNTALRYGDINPNIVINKGPDDGILSFSRSRENNTVYFISNQNTGYKNIDIKIFTGIPHSKRQDPITQQTYIADQDTKISFNLLPESSIILVKGE